MASANLWRHSDFRKLWIGETVSLLGSEFTSLALPLLAALTLGATPMQMGVLVAADTSPYLLLGLPAGVWVDRLRRKPLLITTNIARAAILVLVALLAFANQLTIGQLLVAAFVSGSFSVLFGATYQSYLPVLVEREQLVDGNAKLESSRAVTQAAGPGIAGSLIQLVSAPFVLLLDAVSYLVSAACIGLIRAPEQAPVRTKESEHLGREIAEGLAFVFGDLLLRATTLASATFGFAGGVWSAAYLLFVIRELGIGPALLGFILMFGNIGPILGASLASRVSTRFGIGPVIVWTGFLGGLGLFLVPLADENLIQSFALLVLANLLVGFSDTIFVINVVSLRQAITPDRLQGRVNASVRSVADGMVPFGALIGGPLAGLIGLRNTLAVGAVGAVASVAWIWFSPVRTLGSLDQ